MRNFKFRVWDKKFNKFWHEMEGATKHGIILTSNGDPGLVSDLTTIYEPKAVNIFDKEFLEIQQFTGFFDKNGMEIYEGDIVNYKDGNLLRIVTWRQNKYQLIPTNFPENKSVCSLSSLITPYTQIVAHFFENNQILNESAGN